MRRALLTLLCTAAGAWATEMQPPSTPSENQPPSTPSTGDVGAAGTDAGTGAAGTGTAGADAAGTDAAGTDATGAGAVVVVQNPMPPPPPPPPIFIDWERLAENIITSSLLPGNKQSFLFKHGLTVETDTLALVAFFNNTAASYEACPPTATPPTRPAIAHSAARARQGTTPSNPYRGAMARMSEWKHQEGWSSIVTAHSEVAVQCKALYMEGGTEFKATALRN